MRIPTHRWPFGSVLLLVCLAGLVGAGGPAQDPGDVDGTKARDRQLVSRPHPSIDPAGRGSALPGFDSLTAATLERGLNHLGLDRAQLGFDKMYVEDDTFRLAIVEKLLEDPLSLAAIQAGIVDSVRRRSRSPWGLTGLLGGWLEVSEGDGVHESAAGFGPDPVESGSATEPDSFVAADWKPRIARIGSLTDHAADELGLAFGKITEREASHVLVGAPLAWGQEEDPGDKARKGALHFELGIPADTTLELKTDIVLDAGARLDRPALLRAGDSFLRAVELWEDLGEDLLRSDATTPTALGRLAGGSVSPDAPAFQAVAAEIRGAVVAAWPSEHGWFVIGGPGDDVYSDRALEEIAFLLDLGGDDVYRGRAGSAVGGLLRPLGAIVDLAGDDHYDAGGRSYALGGAVFGCAALLDLEGNDTYRGDDGSLGAGYFGIGVLYDGGGRDDFEGRNLTQGAGAFGLGLLVSAAPDSAPPGPEIERDVAYDEGFLSVPRTGSVPVRHDENDRYEAALQSQGFASTFGVGLLYDDRGNDVYRAGGRYLHAPLLPHDFQSLSQGFAIGMRPRAAGGIGLLLDEEGNDFYDAEVYAQGTSYWYSLGLLFDGGGNDRYLASQYAQGAGVHLSVGSLWDRGGDDHYVSKNGVVQGTAHDLSVALFLDESGNDVYAVSGGQGVSLTNSFALFVDGQGDDLYATFEGSRGIARYRRGFSGAAVFLDLEGTDQYPADEDATNGASWMSSDFAVGIDLDRDVTLPTEAVPEIVLTADDSTRAVEELFETASLWEVGSAREKVRRARLALVARGEDAVLYATGATGPYPDGEPLASRSGLVYRTLQELARAHPDLFAERLLSRLHDPREQVQRSVIALLGDMKWEAARAPLEELLGDPSQEAHWNRTLQALGKLGVPESARAIRPFAHDPAERRRIVSLEALKLLGDTLSVPIFVESLRDSLFTVRSAAMSGLVSLAVPSLEPLLTALEDPDPRLDRASAVRVLGRVAFSLRDSTSGPAGEAGLGAREALLRVFDGELGSVGELPGGAAPDPRDVAVAAAALQGLLRLEDRALTEELVDRVGPDTPGLLRRMVEEEGR